MLTLRRLLFPTDGSACAERAYGYAANLARRHGAELHILHILPPGHGPDAPSMTRVAEPALGVVRVQTERRAVSPLVGVLEYVQEQAIDLIVLGTHGRTGVGRLLLGSVAEDIVRFAECPVLTVNEASDPDVEPRRILAPVDFSPDSWLAVAYARHLAALTDAHLDLLHVVETLPSYGLVEIPPSFPPVSAAAEAETHRALADLAMEAGGPDVPTTTHVVAGHPTIGVLETIAALEPDLVILPTHGRTGLRRLVLGSVAEQVVRRAACPVLVVRGEGRGLRPPPAPSGDGALASIDVPLP